MKGTVADGAFRSLAGARVEVLDGPQAGMTTITDSRGEFSFPGTFADETRFRAALDGYAPSVRPLQPLCAVCNPGRWVHFYLDSVTPPVNMAGEYMVTFQSACANLPADVQSRSYEATVGPPPYDAQVSIPLRGGTFVKGWDSLPMGVAADYVAFWLEILVEEIAPNTYLTFNALAAANVGTAAKSTYRFPLDGSIEYCVTTPGTGTYADCYQNKAVTRVRCGSGDLILTRR
jgi:hypothetical protein